MKSNTAPSARSYNQTTRAEAAAAREVQILQSFRNLLEERWLDEFTLQDVAQGAGVTQQTVIRKFGGKEGLLQALVEQIAREVTGRLGAPVGDPDLALDHLLKDYDQVGDFVMRLLSQEQRFPVLKTFLDSGRRYHRAWVAEVFAPVLQPLKPAPREEALDALVAATDLYIWQLLRRDLGYERARMLGVMRRLVTGILSGLKSEIRGRS